MKYTVLTYIINNYEIVHEIEQKDSEAEYILVTDDPNLKSETWSVFYDPELEGLSVFDKCYQIRFNWYKYCNTDLCVRVDGSMAVKRSLAPLVEEFVGGGYDICLMPHPMRDNFPDEYDVWVRDRNYPREQADKCLAIMAAKGYDFSYKGLFQFGFCIQRKDQRTMDLNRSCLELMMEMGSDGKIERLDQIPLSFLMNTDFSDMKVLPVSEQLLHSVYIQHYDHNSSRMMLNKNYDIDKDDMKYMFNQPVKCMYLDIPLTLGEVHKREKELHDVISNLQRENLILHQERQNLYQENMSLQYTKKRYKHYKKNFIICAVSLAVVIIAVAIFCIA